MKKKHKRKMVKLVGSEVILKEKEVDRPKIKLYKGFKHREVRVELEGIRQEQD